MGSYKKDTFIDKYGKLVAAHGFTQVPNIALRHAKELGVTPLDLSILNYLSSYPESDFHSVPKIAAALGKHEKTIRTAFKRMEKARLVRKIFRTGEANQYDISGWRSRIREYPILHQGSSQNDTTDPTQKSSYDPTAILGTNKDN